MCRANAFVLSHGCTSRTLQSPSRHRTSTSTLTVLRLVYGRSDFRDSTVNTLRCRGVLFALAQTGRREFADGGSLRRRVPQLVAAQRLRLVLPKAQHPPVDADLRDVRCPRDWSGRS